MAIISRWFITTATRLASDPRLRAKAVEVFEKEVKPRAAETWRKAKPKLEATRNELTQMARDTDAVKNPGAFAARIKKRYIDGDGKAERRPQIDEPSISPGSGGGRSLLAIRGMRGPASAFGSGIHDASSPPE